MSGGLIDQSIEAGEAATSSLGEAATNAARKAVADMRQKQSAEAGLGEVVGLGLGYEGARKPLPGVVTGQQDQQGKGSGLSMLLGTMAQRILPGMLKYRQSIGQIETNTLPPAGAAPDPTTAGNP